MTTPKLWLLVTIGLATTITSAVVLGQNAGASVAAKSPRQAVERALPLLQESARIWTRERRCFSCHHQGLGITAVALARERGFSIDQAKLAAEVDSTRRQLAGPDVGANLAPNAVMIDDALMLVAMAAAGEPRTPATDREVYRLLGGQQVSGRWTAFSQRVPLEGSHVAHTAWAIRALRLFGAPSLQSQVDAHIRRGTDWLSRQPAADTQDLAMQLLGLAWSDAPRDRIQPVVMKLLALQRPDGGWGQTATRSSDAYATGQALVALNQAGRVPPTTASFKKGLDFLIAAQQPDGSWLVETRRTWRRGLAYFESGFPYGKHQFISYAGAAWATMALALADRDERSPTLMGTPRPKQNSMIAADSAEGNGLTPLMRAALLGTLEEFRAALKADPDVNALATALGVTALMCAAHDSAKVSMLIEAGADVRAATTAGHTALLIAADYDGAAESVRLLLKQGADPNARSRGTSNSALTRAALRGDRAVVAMLIDGGAAVNGPDGSSALMAAVSQSDADLITFLLDRGADVDSHPISSAPVTNGEAQPTALMIAADRGAGEVVDLLLRRGANVNAIDLQGMTPLMYAAGAIDIGSQAKSVVEKLLAAKADVAARSKSGDTALDFAVRYGKSDLAALLKTAAASPAQR
jgi:ankyrin repeat protein